MKRPYISQMGHQITALVVDDDKKSREVLEYHLRRIPEIEIIGSASGADEALSLLLEKAPDILFLDVEMPGRSGFDLLADLRKLNIAPCIIFQTAFDKYAIEAIKHAAFDYLLKPIDKEELLVVLARYKNQTRQTKLDEKINDLCHFLNRHEKIRFSTRHGFIMIDPVEIVYCKADWNYTEIWMGSEVKEVVTINLGKVEEALPSGDFYRISRSVIINRNFIEKLDRKTRMVNLCKGEHVVELKVAASHLNRL